MQYFYLWLSGTVGIVSLLGAHLKSRGLGLHTQVFARGFVPGVPFSNKFSVLHQTRQAAIDCI